MKIVVLSVYVLLMLMIGWLGMKKSQTISGFFLGDRNIGAWFSAFAYGTTYFSAVLFIGYAGKIGWSFGLSALWIVAGNAFIGGYLAWRVLAGRTRRMTEKFDVITLPEFLEARYDDKGLKIFGALIIFIFLVPYSASVYQGLSYLFEAVFNIPYILALLLIALITAAYLVMGGYNAVALSDFIQGLIMLVGAVLIILIAVKNPIVGGFSQIIERLSAIDPKLASPVGPPGLLPLISLVILTSLGCWGLPQMAQKFFSIKNEGLVKKATVIVTVFSLVIALGAYFTGSLTSIYYPPVDGKPPMPYDTIMPSLIQHHFPEAMKVIIFLLILSASMSTLAGLVLVSSSAIVVDLVKGYIKKDISKTGQVLLMRILCALFIGVSLVLALKQTVIVALMSLSWGTVAGAFLAPYLYGLYWRRGTRIATWVSMAAGLLISAGLSAYYRMDPGLIPLFGSLAMIISLAIYPVVSLLTPQLPKDVVDNAFGDMESGGYGASVNKRESYIG